MNETYTQNVRSVKFELVWYEKLVARMSAYRREQAQVSIDLSATPMIRSLVTLDFGSLSLCCTCELEHAVNGMVQREGTLTGVSLLGLVES